MTDKKTMLTQDGYNKLVEKLDYLKSVRRIEVSERLKAAIALGDLSENSEYDDAKNEQGRLESEISELEAKLRNSDIIHAAANTGKVMIGSTVTVRDVELDEEDTYMIVGSTEADPDNNKISDESPLGVALLNQSAGVTVQVHAPAGVIEFEILDVK
ncbi:MAG: transcription elongation factor GreA [Selenomonadaceae bacterium]|nr:transcription elongation factor GreA [Selenomonadaceae bacterium]